MSTSSIGPLSSLSAVRPSAWVTASRNEPGSSVDSVHLSEEAHAASSGIEGLLDAAVSAMENFGMGIGKDILSQLPVGKYNLPAPSLPAYPTLNPAQKAQAAARGGSTVAEPVIQDPGGGHHEPVTIICSGSLANLKKDLTAQGWSSPGVIPMSQMEVDGKPAVLSLQKNAQLGGLSRDHLRVFSLGTDKSTGQPLWGVAASRDTNPFVRVSKGGNVSFAHDVDPNVNGERDLVMHDLLAASPEAAKTWQVDKGQLTASDPGYTSDGQVYTCSV